MGVYINMEMPKDGVYWCEIGIAGEIATITIHGEDRKSFPLVPVPSHGDLIDRGELFKNKQHYEYLSDEYYITVRDIEEAPTIIPAEPYKEKGE